jgi:hypothetical protein
MNMRSIPFIRHPISLAVAAHILVSSVAFAALQQNGHLSSFSLAEKKTETKL